MTRSLAPVPVATKASSTCGISGLPFTFHDEEGEERQVADGAFKNFLPTLDENSITVKPFCAGVDVLKLTGQRADIGPSEFVPGSFGVFPPPRTLLQHLYELGYRDTETWLQLHLEERLRDIAKTAEEEAVGVGAQGFSRPWGSLLSAARLTCRPWPSAARMRACFGTRRSCNESL